MNPDKQIAIIAPERVLSALSVLIRSAPDLNILAEDSSIVDFESSSIERSPDVFLLYLPKEPHGSKTPGVTPEEIRQLKEKYPTANSIVIFEGINQREKVQSLGVDTALLEGVSPGEILAAIESLELSTS